MSTIYPTVMDAKGMVVSPHYLASTVGARIMRDGGNAVDAAIATNAILGVTYPHMCGIGGDAFFLIFDAETSKLAALNASGRSPFAAKIELYKQRNMFSIPIRGMLSVTVPGVVDGWFNALRRYGTMELSELLQPAIHYAEKGIPITEKFHWGITENIDILMSNPKLVEIYFKDGKLVKPGELIVQKDLAASLRKIAKDGRYAFYNGEIAEAIVKFSEEHGGLLSKKDLSDHTSNWVEPISTSYRGFNVYAFPPNTQGVATLLLLNIMEGCDINKMSWDDPEYIHLSVEAKKIAFNIRDSYISDPDFVKIPLKKILSKKYASELRENIPPSQVKISGNQNCPLRGDTVHIATMDKKGNAVSLIQSLYYPFGSGLVIGDTGIILQNRGAYFSLADFHVNRLEPHKRTLHTLSPLIVMKNEKPVIIMGTMGADGQAQTHFQVLSKIIDFKMGVQEAVESPRWLSGRFEIGEPENMLRIEGRISKSILQALKMKGHIISSVPDWSQIMGMVQAIMVNRKTGWMGGGADPRGDSAAVGLVNYS